MRQETENRTGGLLNIGEVAKILNASTRQVYRLVEGGLLPGPMRIGGLVRWRDSDIQDWIRDGCGTINGSKEEKL